MKNVFFLTIFLSMFSSCSANDYFLDGMSGNVKIGTYSNLDFDHQSAAIYGNYVLFVTNWKKNIIMYDISKKEIVYNLTLKASSGKDVQGGVLYHCNQSCFGVDRYDEDDYFPLLYISQRARKDNRCFTEVYRIIPEINDYEICSFDIELIQIIYYPAMTYDNSMGNVNTVIDTKDCLMYTYSRNNDSTENNYQKCKISCFEIPNIDKDTVYLEDKDIIKSFSPGCSALYMQGGCINDGKLFVGQGSYSVGYIYLRVFDLEMQEMIAYIDLKGHGKTWEPQGCFWYNNQIMISSKSKISNIKLSLLK